MAFVLFSIKNAKSFNTGEIDNPDNLGAVALDEHTLQVTLERRYAYFLYSLYHPSAYPVHRATIESFGSATDRLTPWTRVENYVGNGPFKLSDWKLYRQVTVERSSSYWDAANVRLKAIVFHPVENEVAEEKMFRSGRLRATNGIPCSKIIAYRSLEDSPFIQFPLNGRYYYLINTDKPPLADVGVRRALAMPIDRKKLVSTILNNAAIPAYAITPAGAGDYHPPQTFGYNVEKARHILKDAGYPNGDGWPGLEILFNTSESHRQLAEAIQEIWRESLNIEVSLINKEWKVYLDDANQRHFQLTNT